MKSAWRIENFCPDHRHDPEEWWAVTDDAKSFIAGTREDAEWLLTIINERDKQP